MRVTLPRYGGKKVKSRAISARPQRGRDKPAACRFREVHRTDPQHRSCSCELVRNPRRREPSNALKRFESPRPPRQHSSDGPFTHLTTRNTGNRDRSDRGDDRSGDGSGKDPKLQTTASKSSPCSSPGSATAAWRQRMPRGSRRSISSALQSTAAETSTPTGGHRRDHPLLIGPRRTDTRSINRRRTRPPLMHDLGASRGIRREARTASWLLVSSACDQERSGGVERGTQRRAGWPAGAARFRCHRR
jgi:hypothetical protein